MPDDYIRLRLQGRRILVVEDDYLQAEEMRVALGALRATVIGPVPSVEEALDRLAAEDPPDAAVLDVRLGRGPVFPLVDVLRRAGVPVVFASASPHWSLPEPYEDLPHCEKPLDMGELLLALAGVARAR
ncbi:response regulator [Rubellimicrobium aerolatum]|uniref:Response regulator n=1 Tax=Rubellimicrobium aerolatum TaxID=490979 RepID=A0ABW0SAM2_9RHOB|nr:response regulator [Rubellimicrobium aerolatum]MBP1806113.1 CheY-like chemotaxis protein [Rubellimicrobium aerolatum]